MSTIRPYASSHHTVPFATGRTSGEAPAPQDSVSLGGGSHQVDVQRRIPSKNGGWIELLHDGDPHFVQRPFLASQHQKNPEIVKAFGTSAPRSGDVLLHYAGDPPPGVKKQPFPVLLVHGAIKTGDFFWDPKEDGSGGGLPQRLREQGFEVYAVTFAHNHDDNLFQAQCVANAIDRVKQLTKAPQVDLVAHSKGGMAARCYVSDFREPWMTPFRHDVRRVLFAASPLGGIDYTYRHPSGNYMLWMLDKINAPMSWDNLMVWGTMQDAGPKKFNSEHFAGQAQMLRRWDHRYNLGFAEPDWYTTYHGGRGFVSTSRGIDGAIADSGHFMERLMETPISPDVQVAVLAGNKADLPGILNEYTGPSDGLLFVESALDLPKTTNVVAEAVLPYHHKALLAEPVPEQWIADVLSARDLKPLSDKQRQRVEKIGVSGEAVTAGVPTRLTMEES